MILKKYFNNFDFDDIQNTENYFINKLRVNVKEYLEILILQMHYLKILTIILHIVNFTINDIAPSINQLIDFISENDMKQIQSNI